MQGNDEASRRLDNEAGCAAKRRRSVAFTLTNGRTGRVIGVDDFAVGHRFTLRQPTGLLLDPMRGGEGGRELGVQARPLLLQRAAARRARALGRPAPGAGPARPTPANVSPSGAPASQIRGPSPGIVGQSGGAPAVRWTPALFGGTVGPRVLHSSAGSPPRRRYGLTTPRSPSRG